MTALLPAGPAHAALLAALHQAAFADPGISGPPWDEAAFASLLATPGSFAFVAQTAAGPAGLVLARRAADEAEILTIGILPARRQNGLGRRLLEAAAEAARAAGADRLFLEVAENNLPARALYLAAGFREAGRRRGYYRLAGGAVDALLLARPLAPVQER